MNQNQTQALKVVDLQNLIQELPTDCNDDFKMEYFVLQKQGDKFFDPLDFDQFCANQPEEICNSSSDSDQDSQDSNRESASQNDYPDEDEAGLHASSDEGRRYSSSESEKNDSFEQDIPKMKNSLFEKLMKKNKAWVPKVAATETGLLDDYEPNNQYMNDDY